MILCRGLPSQRSERTNTAVRRCPVVPFRFHRTNIHSSFPLPCPVAGHAGGAGPGAAFPEIVTPAALRLSSPYIPPAPPTFSSPPARERPPSRDRINPPTPPP